ncbi:MAG: HDOD domain-containing protein [Bryobacteraceae bacterium]|nr:HDOD domain-containing protein [Bryobacteraceae bacterium]
MATRPAALRELPPFPPVAARLMRLLAQETPSLKEIADLIRTDAVFASQVLRLANSSLFSLRYQVVDILHAVAVLGLNRISGLVMTVAMKDFFLTAKQHKVVRQCWQHNLATAIVAELLAEASWMDKAIGYNAGLLHDVGLLALSTSDPGFYEELIQSGETTVESFRRREFELGGIDHCEAGRWLLETWGFSSDFQQVAARHHDPPRDGDLEVTDLTRKACAVASMTGFPVCNGVPEWEPQILLSWLCEPARERFRIRVEELPLTIATKINSFDCDFLT